MSGKVVGVGHGGSVGDDTCFADRADEHAVGIQIHILLHLQAHKGVDVPGQEPQAVVAAHFLDAGKLIGGEDSGDKGGKYHNYTNEAPEKVNYWSIVTWGGACQSFCFKGIPGEIFIRHPEKL